MAALCILRVRDKVTCLRNRRLADFDNGDPYRIAKNREREALRAIFNSHRAGAATGAGLAAGDVRLLAPDRLWA